MVNVPCLNILVKILIIVKAGLDCISFQKSLYKDLWQIFNDFLYAICINLFNLHFTLLISKKII